MRDDANGANWRYMRRENDCLDTFVEECRYPAHQDRKGSKEIEEKAIEVCQDKIEQAMRNRMTA